MNALLATEEQIQKTFRRAMARFVVAENGCWEWQGSTNGNGYGVIGLAGTKLNIYVHRLVMLAAGHDIDGKVVCHHCDNRPCMNPAHLFVGTHQDNMRDCQEKGRMALPPVRDWKAVMREQPHHWQKLRREDIPAIRARLAAGGETQAAIAADFGVTHQAISKISTGTRWSHV